MADDSGSSERKGLIYEVFAALAMEHAFGTMPVIQPKLKNVIADQDLAWPDEEAPRLVASVTHWGSHDAANKKFWRVHEDLFELHAAYPKAGFLSIVFDRNPNSDQNLCMLLEAITSNLAISDLNCPIVLDLQDQVATAALQKRFGSGIEQVIDKARSLLKSDVEFNRQIAELGDCIRRLFHNWERTDILEEVVARGTASPANHFRDPGHEVTYFKQALLVLIDIGSSLKDVIECGLRESWGELPESTLSMLVNNGSIREKAFSLEVEYEATEVMAQLIARGYTWCNRQLCLLQEITSDKDHALYAYHDHLSDVIDREGCERRLQAFISTTNPDDLVDLILDWNHGLNRCWPIDYAIILHRENVRGKSFGVKKLSSIAGIPYSGAPISCPLPRYASGDTSQLSRKQIENLAHEILELRRTWRASSINVSCIQKDRRVSLLKKFSALDAVLENYFRRVLPSAKIHSSVSIRHPLHEKSNNAHAGSTVYNLCIEANGRRTFVFIIAAYGTGHKHKEVSGRLRAAIAAGSITPDDLCLLLIDGNLLSDTSRTNRIEMMKSAGWSGAYTLDQLDDMTVDIASHLGIGFVGAS